MPVRLIAETEKLEWKHSATESGLYYRRITSAKGRDLRSQHTVKGVVDQNALMDAVMEYCVLGWFGVIGEDGQPIEFKKEYIAALPELYKTEFVDAIYAYDPTVAEQGN